MKFLLLIFAVTIVSCGQYRQYNQDVFNKVSKIQDSIQVGDMLIRNAFKYQVLAHQGKTFDSLMIKEKVYKPNRYVFDNCLAMIFGDENSKKFGVPGMYKWNRNLLKEQDSIVKLRLAVLDSVNINTLFTHHLNAVQKLTGQKGKGSWLVYFGPENFQIFGGCDNNAMMLDMMGYNWNTKDINEVFAHELEHLIFNPVLEHDIDGQNGLGMVLDEGLAVYFTSVYLHQSEEQALQGEYTSMLKANEKLIFSTLSPYFFKGENQNCPLAVHTGRSNECDPVVNIAGLPESASRELGYFLGFRIIQQYVLKHGKDSWQDIYKIPLKEFYENSGYSEFVMNK